MDKKETIAKRIKKRYKSPYTYLAKKYDTSYLYVHQIARGERNPVRGKGLLIKNELEQYI